MAELVLREQLARSRVLCRGAQVCEAIVPRLHRHGRSAHGRRPAPNNNLRALVIMPGRAYTGQARPCGAVTDCLEDPENTDGDDVFSKSAVTPSVNDRLLVVSP